MKKYLLTMGNKNDCDLIIAKMKEMYGDEIIVTDLSLPPAEDEFVSGQMSQMLGDIIKSRPAEGAEDNDDVFNKMNCLIGYLERWLNNPQSYPPVELKSVIDEALEYLKTREK